MSAVFKKKKNGTKWWSQSLEGLLSMGPTPSSFYTQLASLSQAGLSGMIWFLQARLHQDKSDLRQTVKSGPTCPGSTTPYWPLGLGCYTLAHLFQINCLLHTKLAYLCQVGLFAWFLSKLDFLSQACPLQGRLAFVLRFPFLAKLATLGRCDLIHKNQNKFKNYCLSDIWLRKIPSWCSKLQQRIKAIWPKLHLN